MSSNKDKSKIATDTRSDADKIQQDRKEKSEQSAMQDIHDLQSIMKNEGGRRFICKLLEDSGIFSPSFTGNSTTFYNEGRRSLGLNYVPALEEHCPEDYLKMLAERLNRLQGNK